MTGRTKAAGRVVGYTLDNGWDQAQRRLELIEEVLDSGTMRRLTQIGVGPGWRCLEVGAGGGSITRWLCDRAGPAGQVVAVDLDTRFIDTIRSDNLVVRQADIATLDLPSEAFDLVHTRLLLMHLPQRDEILGRLIRCLRPGGRLLIEEADDFPLTSLASGLYRTVLDAYLLGFSEAGVAFTWARRLPELFADRGIGDIVAEIDVPYFEGGTPAAEVMRLTGVQARPLAEAAGADAADLDAWDHLVTEPGRWFPCFAVVAVQGRRPVGRRRPSRGAGRRRQPLAEESAREGYG